MNIGSRGASILLFAVSVVMLLWMRPRFLIDDETDDWKAFGFGPGKSVLNVSTVIILLALGAYLLSACIGTSICQWRKRGSQTGGAAGLDTPVTATPAPVVPAQAPAPVAPIVPVQAPVMQNGGGAGIELEPFGSAFGPAFSLLQ